jgi:hypothetical protein
MNKIGFAVLLLNLVGVMATVPASASTLYDNTAAGSYNTTGYYIEAGYQYDSVTDSFTLSSASTITGATFASWTDPGATFSNVDWAITTAPFGGTTVASGSQSDPYTGYIGAGYGYYDIDSNSISIGSLSLGAGTYWLNLYDATATDGGVAAWDASVGPSTAYSLNTSDEIPSETFTIQGASTTTPEPSSFLLLGSGLAGFAGMIRRKLKA